MNKKITGLMICDPKGIVAINHHLPWHFPEEVTFFRQIIAQQIIILGYTTYLEMPKWLLKKSYCIVFSRDISHNVPDDLPNLVFVSNLNEFLGLKNLPLNKACFLIGGAAITKFFLEHQLLDAFLLTITKKYYWGDTVIPLSTLHVWPKIQLSQTSDFDIYYYTNPFSRYNK